MRSRSASLRRAQPLLGTVVEIGAAGRAAALADGLAAAFAAIAEVGRLMSYHDPASDLARLNREAQRRPVEVAASTRAVLEAALALAAASGGAFDPCVAPALVRLGFLPGPADGRAARGWEAVELLGGRRVRLARALALDLGGIAKGYAVDCACAALERAGIADYVVNAGGDLRVGARARPVHVRHPAEPRALVALGTLSNAAVATSARYFAARARAQPLHPIISPATGAPAAYSGSISVLAPSCLLADALTKVVAVRGPGAAPLLARYGAELRWLGETGRWRCWPATEPTRAARAAA
jgi:thiamine biosynthesis lipoprotein